MIKLPENFESYGEARKNGFLKMKELKETGKKIVGVYCSFVPTELVEAAGGTVVSLCATSEEPIAAAEADLPRNLCPLIKASYGFALQDTCPYFYFSDFIVGETTCDGKKKMFELMNDIKETYVMQLPSVRDEAALDAWEKEIIRFWKKLEDFYQITITEEDVKKAIELKNKERDVMLRFLELGKLNPAPISGYEMGSRLDSLGFNPDIEGRCRIIEERTQEVIKDWEENYKGKPSRRPRILVTGCPNSGIREKTIRVIEELGADVVAFDCCNGTREKVEKVDTTLPVTRALAKKYLNINCSVMSPNQTRMDYISEMIDDYQVDGVLELVLQACHTYAIEAYHVKKTAAKKGVPYLRIETDYSTADSGQINTRLEAFMETLEK
ncbi:MAG: double-cubane-cluster-containing anaerobic reductase [Ruminococcus sp.]|nr:double-cubane-cluster-containing anaerobic reductase [Ruminococcus sp.]